MLDNAHNKGEQSARFLTLYKPVSINGDFQDKHIVSVEQFSREDLLALFRTASAIKQQVEHKNQWALESAAGRLLVTLFDPADSEVEEIFRDAVGYIGGKVIELSTTQSFSSLQTSESFADIIRAAGVHADVLVLQHPEIGAAHKAAYYLDQLRKKITGRPIVLDSGCGNQNTTGALADLFTIFDSKSRLDQLKMTFIGGILNNGTIESLLRLMAHYGAKNMDIRMLASPSSSSLPEHIITLLRERGISVDETNELGDEITNSDVFYLSYPAVVSSAEIATLSQFLPLVQELVRLDGGTVLLQNRSSDPISAVLNNKQAMESVAKKYLQQLDNTLFLYMALLIKVLVGNKSNVEM